MSFDGGSEHVGQNASNNGAIPAGGQIAPPEPPKAPTPAPAPSAVPPEIADFDALIKEDVGKFVEIGQNIGGLVAEQVGWTLK